MVIWSTKNIDMEGFFAIEFLGVKGFRRKIEFLNFWEEKNVIWSCMKENWILFENVSEKLIWLYHHGTIWSKSKQAYLIEL